VRKRLTKVRHWGIQIAIVGLLLLVSLTIVSVAPKTTHAAFPIPFDTTPTPTLPLPVPSPVPTQVPPTPTAQPQPTMTPATPPPVPTATATAAPPVPNPGAGAPGGTTLNPGPTPTPNDVPTPVLTSTAPTATTGNTPASTQQQDANGPLDTVFSPVGVSVMLLSVLGVAGVVLLLMRRKQPALGPAGNSASNSIRDAAGYAPVTPVPQALSQMAPPAMAAMPAMMQQELVLPSSEPGQFSLNPHSDVTEVQEVVSAPQAPASNLSMLRGDFNPPHTDYPGHLEKQANENREKMPQPQGAVIMPSALPETPSLHNGGPSEQGLAEPVSTNQLMAVMRQAQGGLFVIPEREQEKQAH
jgi:hypothetical protein